MSEHCRRCLPARSERSLRAQIRITSQIRITYKKGGLKPMTHLLGTARPWRALAVTLAASALTLCMTGVSDAAGPDPAGTIYVADYAASAIDVFAPSTNGNVAPIRSISGPLTGIDGPGDVAVDSSGDVYSSNFNDDTITEYAPGASGNVAPIRTIAGPLTGLEANDDMSLAANGTLYVGNDIGGHIVVFAPGASGNIAPVRDIFGSLTDLGSDVDGVGVDATGTLYAANSDESVIPVFAPGANGDVAPIRTISGSLTDLDAPDDVKVGFAGQLFVTDGGDSLQEFEPGASGDVAPKRDIAGSLTELVDTDDFAVSPSGTMYVSNFLSSSVVVFGPEQNGNVAPMAKIAGPATTLEEPEGVALAPTPIVKSATLTTSTASSITLGGSTHDSGTLAGGTSPTGSMIFKLFRPGDTTCSEAPVFTSPLINVTGDGVYTSPTFAPTATGTYNWVAEYSGDSNNAPVATACGEEPVTVKSESTPATTLSTSLSGAGQSGATITVPEETAVSDDATLSGENASTATGKVVYYIYSDSKCTKLVTKAGEVSVTGGEVPASSAEFLGFGTYYWQATYSGDANNGASASKCGSEIETVTTAEACDTAIGEGHLGTPGPEGLNEDNDLSTSKHPHELEVGLPGSPSHEGHIHLSSITSATCTKNTNEAEFSGTGAARFDGHGGYTLTFAFDVTSGRVFLTLVLEKEGTVVYSLIHAELKKNAVEYIR
jgi:hypothetical protein